MSEVERDGSQFSDSSDASTQSQKQKRRRQRSADQKESEAKRKKEMSLEDIIKKLDALILTSTNNQPKIDQISEFIEKQAVMSTKIETLATEVDDVKERQTKVDNTLPAFCSSLASLTNTQIQMGIHINQLDQKMLENHFVIHNLPPDLAKTDATNVVLKLSEFLGLHLEASHFSTPPYIVQQKKKTSSSVMGAFFDVRQKHQLFKKFKAKTNPGDPSARRPIFVEDIFTTLPPASKSKGNEILLKNQLTPYYRNLLYHAQQQLKFTKMFKYVWEIDGRILARLDDKERIVEIKSNQDLQNILDYHNGQQPNRNSTIPMQS